MTAFSMPCFCAIEGINYKNAFNRSGKSGVLHCLSPSPILRGSRSIPRSVLPAVISSSSEMPLPFGIGFTWLIQTVNRLPLQNQKNGGTHYKIAWLNLGVSERQDHCQNVIKIQWEKMSSLRGARKGEDNGMRREGGAAKVWGHRLCLQHPASPCPPLLALTQFAYGWDVQSFSLSHWRRMENVDTILFWGVSSLSPWQRVSFYHIPLYRKSICWQYVLAETLIAISAANAPSFQGKEKAAPATLLQTEL